MYKYVHVCLGMYVGVCVLMPTVVFVVIQANYWSICYYTGLLLEYLLLYRLTIGVW